VAWRNGLRAGLEFLAKNAPLHLPAQAVPSTLQTESAAELAQPKPDRTEPAQAAPATFDIDTLPPR
jgi:hypothetical protein